MKSKTPDDRRQPSDGQKIFLGQIQNIIFINTRRHNQNRTRINLGGGGRIFNQLHNRCLCHHLTRVLATFSPTEKASVSVLETMPCCMSRQKFCIPATRFSPPLLSVLSITSGFVAGKFAGDMASMYCVKENATGFCLFRQSPLAQRRFQHLGVYQIALHQKGKKRIIAPFFAEKRRSLFSGETTGCPSFPN